MANQEKVEALVLSRRNTGEADRLVTLFTREWGVRRVMAKGVRRIPSRRGGHLEPVTCIGALLAGSPERSYLAAVETKDYFHTLHADDEALAAAHRLGGTAARLFEYGTPYARIYEALKYAWEVLARLELQRRHVLEVAVAMLMLGEAGVMPALPELSAAGVSLSEPGRLLWQRVSSQPREALLLPAQAEGAEVVQAMRQYLRHAFPLPGRHPPAGG